MAEKPYISNEPSNLAEIKSVARPIRNGALDVWIDLDLETVKTDTDPFTLAMAMTNSRDVRLACTLAKAMTKVLGTKCEQSVYVISTIDPKVCKIGIAGSP